MAQRNNKMFKELFSQMRQSTRAGEHWNCFDDNGQFLDGIEIFLEYDAAEKMNRTMEAIQNWLTSESEVGIWFGHEFFLDCDNQRFYFYSDFITDELMINEDKLAALLKKEVSDG